MLSAYCELIDSADFNGLGDLFSDGALLDPDGRELARGRDAVADFYRRTVILHDGSPRTRHTIVDPVVDADETQATARTGYVVSQDGAQIITGRYEDKFRRADGGWAFAERRFFVDEVGDLSKHIRLS